MSIHSADLGASRPVVGALAEHGFSSLRGSEAGDRRRSQRRRRPRPIPTGSGKTLALGVPIVDRLESNGPRQAALVLAPTRELAEQIVEDIRPLAHVRALRIAAVYGGVGFPAQIKRACKAHIIAATPPPRGPDGARRHPRSRSDPRPR